MLPIQFRSIQEYLAQPPPRLLWHYTSIAGLKGIVESKTIYATDIRFLNDRTEFNHAIGLLGNIAELSPEQEFDGFPFREAFRRVTTVALRGWEEGRWQIFVTSFSSARDLLSQWRGYSHGSPGLSLGFDLRALMPDRSVKYIQSLAPCLYDRPDQELLLRLACHSYMQSAKALWAKGLDHSPKENIPPLVPDYGVADQEQAALHHQHASLQLQACFDLIVIASLCKHPSFREEEEWRIVTPLFGAMPGHNVQFRVGPQHLVPYKASGLSAHPRKDLPLTDLILGPGSSQRAIDSASMFLRSNGFHFEPKNSTVPFSPD